MNVSENIKELLIKIKKFLITKTAKWLAFSIGLLILSKFIGPAILSAIEAPLSKSMLLALLLGSFTLNILFIVIFWIMRKRSKFKLK